MSDSAYGSVRLHLHLLDFVPRTPWPPGLRERATVFAMIRCNLHFCSCFHSLLYLLLYLARDVVQLPYPSWCGQHIMGWLEVLWHTVQEL